MVITNACECGGEVKLDLGPYFNVEETQVVQGSCDRCGETYTLRTNINRRMK